MHGSSYTKLISKRDVITKNNKYLRLIGWREESSSEGLGRQTEDHKCDDEALHRLGEREKEREREGGVRVWAYATPGMQWCVSVCEVFTAKVN